MKKLTEQQGLALEIIESVYTDGVDAISEPEVDPEGNVVVKFQDGAKLLNAKIYPDKEENDIEIWMDKTNE